MKSSSSSTSSSKKSSKSGYPPIRLTSASASRNAQIHEMHQKMQAGTWDEESAHQLDTRNPNGHALHLLSRVSKATGAAFQPVGRGNADKLASVRVEPAGALLAKTSWREFFKQSEGEGQLDDRPRSGGSSSSSRGRGGGAGGGSRGSSRERKVRLNEDYNKDAEDDDDEQVQQQQQDLLNSDPFIRMVTRVEALWKEVRMSREDRSFYRKSLLRFPPKSHEHFLELARYVAVLQQHRLASIKVMQSITLREECLRRCYDVLRAMRRKSAAAAAAVSSSSVQSAKTDGLTDTNFLRSNSVRDATDNSSLFWKEELVVVLKDLQLASLEVIRRIQLWRRDLWRPRPFLWSKENVDYLSKMQRDMEVLESSSFVASLASIPLKRQNLACVLYANAANDNDNVDASEAQFYSASEAGLEETPLRTAFLANVQWSELRAAAQVVDTHNALMAALNEEHAKLVQSGVFIPTLRLVQGNGGDATRASGGV